MLESFFFVIGRSINPGRVFVVPSAARGTYECCHCLYADKYFSLLVRIIFSPCFVLGWFFFGLDASFFFFMACGTNNGFVKRLTRGAIAQQINFDKYFSFGLRK